ncbi:4-hydroxy-3-polyprenylbenzoate decarboxylase [Ruminiclostridium sufflavum DSM 19573]|uniref:4-hydroxy-3-polyprenylbenzoate decarboxylase n=1 Tax=Ruminiclostridium sufflavum DSM 19573 TaxID=1121337 RepID=A0A318XUB6_9FIRM|nr:UbiX family flavin prenyltransferase [Ruminiclostridium sufflavum]PYG90230.1 4-hydroxy-3-polyprenylbenzoate decarboxylase [Ruminiclostridium sufflavum DSM 19573]
MSKRIAVAVTGASGSIYALRTIQLLKEYGCEVYLVMSEAAIETVKLETCLDFARAVLSKVDGIFDNKDIGCSLASGSFQLDALLVIPCSVNTVGMLHSSLANTLIGRCAVVAQKEKRQIVLVPREMPMTALTLKQLYELSMLGMDICIASPGFYSKPATMNELIDHVVSKVLNILGIKNNLIPEWNRRFIE